MRQIIAALAVAGLTGCSSTLAEVEQVGSESFDALEGSSNLGVRACKRYLGGTARVGPLLEWLDTEEKRNAWLALFSEPPTPLP